jgi:hypothetical protein
METIESTPARQEARVRALVEEYLDKYLGMVDDFGFRMQVSAPEVRDHVVRIGTSILCTRAGIGYPGGSFAKAVVDNDLMGAFGRADSVNLVCIRFYCSLLYNVGV